MRMPTIQVRIDETLADWLENRAATRHQPVAASRRARGELVLFRALLTAELRRFPLTAAEAGLLADIAAGTVPDDVVGGGVADSVEDAMEFYPGVYGQKWAVDEDRLLRRLRAAGPTQLHALEQALADWWRLPDADRAGVEGWRRVGLVIIPAPTNE